MANICPTEVPTAVEKARSIPRQRGANTEVQGQNAASTTFQEVTNVVPGHANKNPNTSKAATENPKIPVDVCDFLADLKRLKEFTTCRICTQEFDNDIHKPCLLPCFDAICESCIKDISSSEKPGLKCNECHCIHTCFHNGQLSLQVDGTRRIASEILRQTNGKSSLVCEMCTNNDIALHRCIDCNLFICADCVVLHSTLKPLKSHTVLETEGLLTDEKNYTSLFRSAIYCPVITHEKELLKMYCLNSSCMKPVCGMCCITTHKDHMYCNIAKAGKEKTTKIRELITKVFLKENQAQKYVVELQNIYDKCVQDSRQLQNEIKTLFGEAKNVLEQRKKSLCDDVAAILNEKQERIKKMKQKMTFFVHSCKDASFYWNILSKTNDHQYFIDIAKSIQLQLENLKSQVIENEISMNTVKFIVKPSDVSFITSINSFGKILATKVSAKKSKVIISQVCEKGKKSRFKIQLFSSTGKPIVDEKVYVYLKHVEHILKTVQCVMGKFSPWYIGIWIPDEPCQLSWTIFSNGIKLDTLEGVIKVKAAERNDNQDIFYVQDDECVEQPSNTTTSFSRNHLSNNLQKDHFVRKDYFSVKAKQKTYQARKQLASSTVKTDGTIYTRVFVGKNTAHLTMQIFSSYTTMKISDKLKVKIYLGNITDIISDAIVCPHDKYCSTENDIAKDIFRNIHDKQPLFKCMNDWYIWSQKLKRHSKWNMIIHAVFPVYDCKAENPTEFGETLKTTIKEIITTAEEAQVHSIAIPFLGTGTEQNHTPVATCSYSFITAVMENASKLVFLNDIYLVIKDKRYKKMFLEHFTYLTRKLTPKSVTGKQK